MRLADDPNYIRLPGGSPALLGPAHYWLAKDHLLLVEVIWLVEKYRRFDLKDLGALTIRPTWVRAWIWSALAVPMAISLALGIYLWLEETETVSRVIAAMLIGLAINLMGIGIWIARLGEGCEVRLITSVQSMILPGIRFRKGAERFRRALVTAVGSMPAQAPSVPVSSTLAQSTPSPLPAGESAPESATPGN